MSNKINTHFHFQGLIFILLVKYNLKSTPLFCRFVITFQTWLSLCIKFILPVQRCFWSFKTYNEKVAHFAFSVYHDQYKCCWWYTQPMFGLVRLNPRWIIQNPIAGFTVWGRGVYSLWVGWAGGETLQDVTRWFRKNGGAAGCWTGIRRIGSSPIHTAT